MRASFPGVALLLTAVVMSGCASVHSTETEDVSIRVAGFMESEGIT